MYIKCIDNRNISNLQCPLYRQGSDDDHDDDRLPQTKSLSFNQIVQPQYILQSSTI